MHTYVLDAELGQAGHTATVQTTDGTVVGNALVTDVDHALTRVTRPSPLEQTSLAALLGDEHQVRALFDALDALRPAAGNTPTGPPARRARQEAQLRAVVGPALLHLALGRDTGPAPQPSDDDAVSPDEAALDNAGDRSSASVASTPATTAAGAVDALTAREREHLQSRFIKLVGRSADWPLPAQLAAYRIVLVVAAGGLWPHPQDWAPVVRDGLAILWSATEDDAFAHEHAALVSVGLIALRHGQLSCPAVPAFADWFEELRTDFRAHQPWLQAAPDELLDHYTADLSGTAFGPRFTGQRVRDDLDWLLGRDPIEETIDMLPPAVGLVQRLPDGVVRVRTAKEPRRTVLLVLDALRDFPDTHVVVIAPTGAETHGWWNPPRLRLLSPAPGGGWQEMIWTNLMTGIANYTRSGALPRPTSSNRAATIAATPHQQ